MASGLMPQVIGKSLGEAKSAIEAEATAAVDVDVSETPGEPAGTVKSQNPEAGNPIPAQVQLVIWEG